MKSKLLLIVGCTALVSCVDASAWHRAKAYESPRIEMGVYVDSQRHVVCYYHLRTGYEAAMSCVALDSTNSHAK